MRPIRIFLPVVCLALLVVPGTPSPAADGSVDVDWMTPDGAGDAEVEPVMARAKALKTERLAGGLDTRAKAPGPAKTVAVDCTKGQSIQAALDQNDGPLVVEVQGVCLENVRIERKTVTLRGSDPTTDGIQGVVAVPQPLAALEIFYSDGVRVENLSISDGPAIGVGMWFSHVIAENLRIIDNAAAGMHVSSGSFLDGLELALSENGGRGLHVQRSSTAFCTGCTLADNGNFAAGAATGGLLSLLDSVVTGQRGLAAANESYADIDCVSAVTTYPCGLSAGFRAAQAVGAATIAIGGPGDFSGQLFSSDRSLVFLLGARQTTTGVSPGGVPVPNSFAFFAMLAAEPIEDELGVVQESKLAGVTHLNGFSKALLGGATELDGTLDCASASDAWADSGVVLTPGSAINGCEHAPPPGP